MSIGFYFSPKAITGFLYMILKDCSVCSSLYMGSSDRSRRSYLPYPHTAPLRRLCSGAVACKPVYFQLISVRLFLDISYGFSGMQ